MSDSVNVSVCCLSVHCLQLSLYYIVNPHYAAKLAMSQVTLATVFMTVCQQRWVGHIMCMPYSRIAKQVFFGQLAVGKRLQYGPVL